MNTTPSALTVNDWFAPDGLIAAVKPGFAPREGQAELSQLILDSDRTGKIVLGQAPTGFGKSFALCVPAIIKALNGGSRIVISTETITLQQQYIDKDLPLLQKALGKRGINFTFAVAKGRGNYVCRGKLDEEVFSGSTPLQMWAQGLDLENSDGDYGTIPRDIEFNSRDWRDIGADDDCETKACRFYGDGSMPEGRTDCFVYASRRKFKEAQIIVANHTFTLLDAMIGVGTLLGPYDLLIVDEAHTLAEKAIDVWGQTFTASTVSRSLMDIDKKLRKVHLGNFFERGYLNEWRELEQEIFTPLKAVSGHTLALRDIKPYYLVERSQMAAETMIDKLKVLRKNLKAESTGTDYGEDMIAICAEKLTKIIGGLTNIYGENMEEEFKDNWLAFLEIKKDHLGGPMPVLNLKPIEVAPLMVGYLWSKLPSAVLVSATMRINNSFAFMRKTMGIPLDRMVEFVGNSPFDFAKNVMGYYPSHLPEQPAYQSADFDEKMDLYLTGIADEVYKVIEYMQGRTMVLFTNMNHMTEVHERIIRRGMPYTMYLQGERGKQLLIDAFTADVSSCLFATRSFFTGVDIPGETLSCVVLTKCPFPVPSDPLFSARVEKIEEKGGKAFEQLSLPMMLFDVQQAFGRLIRTHTDSGLFVLLDSRAMKKSYFPKLRQALPKFPVYKEF
jgi:ATP-dependent DNA helicase DinG